MHLLAVYAHEAQIVLAQLRVYAKTNEHNAALKVLAILPLKGVVVTADAMFTHADFCRKVRKRGGDYILAVKENQPTLRADLEAAFAADAAVSPYQERRQAADRTTKIHNGKGDGRRERRTIVATIELNAYLSERWPGLGQVYQIKRER